MPLSFSVPPGMLLAGGAGAGLIAGWLFMRDRRRSRRPNDGGWLPSNDDFRLTTSEDEARYRHALRVSAANWQTRAVQDWLVSRGGDGDFASFVRDTFPENVDADTGEVDARMRGWAAVFEREKKRQPADAL